jgi:hypothetical protein
LLAPLASFFPFFSGTRAAIPAALAARGSGMGFALEPCFLCLKRRPSSSCGGLWRQSPRAKCTPRALRDQPWPRPWRSQHRSATELHARQPLA